MACTSPQLVTSGYFRVHSYVLLGLNSVSALVAFSEPDRFAVWPAISSAVASYLASAVWLYEKLGRGTLLLVVVSVLSLIGAWLGVDRLAHATLTSGTRARCTRHAGLGLAAGIRHGSDVAGALVSQYPIDATGSAQAIGVVAGGGRGLRAVVSLIGLGLEVQAQGWPTQHLAFVALRWLAGILGTGVVTVMTWQTLKIPNTQSATGILYVGVITTFLGELTAQLLSSQTLFLYDGIRI